MSLKKNIFAKRDTTMDLNSKYQNEPRPEKRQRYLNWLTAKGLQAVDGIQTSAYLDEVAEKNIEGTISSYEASKLIDSYYDVKTDLENEGACEEADKVAARINILIEEVGFSLSAEELKSIHKRLFEGLFDFAGEFRKNNIIKHEWVLDGDTVTYGNAYSLEDAIENTLKAERMTNFRHLDDEELVYHFANFTSRLWCIHPFGEGNTRTTAVFLIKYLKSLGVEADNSLFEQNSLYFRNALVRANYNNIKRKIYEDRSFIDDFFFDLITGTRHKLSSRHLHIYAGFPAVKKHLHPQEWRDKILKLISENPAITRAEMASLLNTSVKTIERQLKKIPSIHYCGSARKGEWQID